MIQPFIANGLSRQRRHCVVLLVVVVSALWIQQEVHAFGPAASSFHSSSRLHKRPGSLQPRAQSQLRRTTKLWLDPNQSEQSDEKEVKYLAAGGDIFQSLFRQKPWTRRRGRQGLQWNSPFDAQEQVQQGLFLVTPLMTLAWTSLVRRPLSFVWHQVHSMTWGQTTLLVMAFAMGIVVGRFPPLFQRFTHMLDIPSRYFGPTAPVLVGRAVSVTDGDTIRFLHQPTPWHPTALKKNKNQKKRQKLSEVALPIRICTIDTPETAKFGKPGQPFGVEAKEALAEFLDNRPVHVRLLQKDQYNRGVAQVFLKSPWLRRPMHVDEYMLKQGLAEVYRGGGAVYGPRGVDRYTVLEETAQTNRVGMWAQGSQRESAADYKKRTKS